MPRKTKPKTKPIKKPIRKKPPRKRRPRVPGEVYRNDD